MIFNLKSQHPISKEAQKPRDLYAPHFCYKDLVSRLNAVKAQQQLERKKNFHSFDFHLGQDSTNESEKSSKKTPSQNEVRKNSNKTILFEKESNENFIRKKRARNLTSGLLELRPVIHLQTFKRKFKAIDPKSLNFLNLSLIKS